MEITFAAQAGRTIEPTAALALAFVAVSGYGNWK
jgi:hypothetical protein